MGLLFANMLLFMGQSLSAQESMPSSSVPDLIGDYDSEAPAWLLRSWGRVAREDRNLSNAFFLLTRSLEKDPENPETLTELALSYFASSDLHQAREYLNRALDNQARLSSPDLKYFILYQLADIYSHSEDSNLDYEQILLEVVSNDEDFVSDELVTASLRKNMRRVLNSQPPSNVTSLDQTIVLYRLSDSFSLEAHIRLGKFYVHSGRYNEAQQHLLFAVTKMYSRLIAKLREFDPLYAFASSREFFLLIERNDTFITYLQKAGFAEALYYLAAASYGFNPRQEFVYRSIWQTLEYLPYSSSYTARAAVRLTNPQKELILYGSDQFIEEVNNP